MDSDKQRVAALEEAYRKLWAEQEELKKRIQDNYKEFKEIREKLGVPAYQIPTEEKTHPVTEVVSPKPAVVQEVKQTMTQSTTPNTVQATPKPTPAKPVATKNTNWEQFIGEQLLSKIGLLILLIGLVIGTKYAIDHNWLTIEARVIGSYGIAAILGFFAFRFREKYRSFSAVLAAGAVSVTYFISYVAFSWYHIFPFALSFGFMFIAVAAAVYLAWYYNLVLIAHFGLVAAYVLPPLISTNNQHLSVYLGYMLLINLGMTVISFLKNWNSIRIPILFWTNVIFVFWFFSNYHEKGDAIVALVYAVLFYLSFHVGAILPFIFEKRKFEAGGAWEVITVTFTSFSVVRYIMYAADYSTLTCVLITTVFIAYLAFWAWRAAQKKEDLLRDTNIIAALIVGLTAIVIDVSTAYQPVYLFILGLALYYVVNNYQYKKMQGLAGALLIGSLAYFFLGSMNHITASDEATHWFRSGIYLSVLSCCALVLQLKLKHNSILGSFIGLMTYGFLGVTFSLEIVRFFDAQIGAEEHSVLNVFRIEPLYKMIGSVSVIAYLMVLHLAYVRFRKFLEHIAFEFTGGVQYLMVAFVSLLGVSIISYHALPFWLWNDNFFSVYVLARYAIFVSVLGVLFWRFQVELKQRNAIVWLSISLLWILSLELAQWSVLGGFGAGYKIVLTLLWVVFSIAMIYRGLKAKSSILRITAMGILGVSMVKLFFYDLIRLGTITKVVVFMLIGALLLVGAYFYQRMMKQEEENAE